MTAAEKRQAQLEHLCRKLKEVDAGIVDIIQFGSSVYAPDLARDVDLLITTRTKKDEALYWDAFAELDVDVDVVLRTPGEPISGDLAASARLLGRVLLGNGETQKEVEGFMAVPTFERARKTLRSGEEILDLARNKTDEILKDEFYRTAFKRLFDAARHAVMAYLNTENTRWGQLRRVLPKPFDQEFRSLVNTLHVLYAYDGKYPQDDPVTAFHTWRQRVEAFISRLEAKSPRRNS